MMWGSNPRPPAIPAHSLTTKLCELSDRIIRCV